MFKKLIMSLPFVKPIIDDKTAYIQSLTSDLVRAIKDKEVISQVLNHQAEDFKDTVRKYESLEKKYTLALSDLQDKNIQIYDLTRLLDAIVDYFIPEKYQPSPLEYKDIPALIIKTCSQKKKSKKSKKSGKKTKQSTSSLVSGLLRK